MSRRYVRSTLAALAIAGLAGLAHAGEVTTLGPLEIDTPWARASVGTARPGVAYVTIRNTGSEPDQLVSIETPVAAHPELHDMLQEGEVVKMRPAAPIEIPPGDEVRLEPGGLHIMLMQLQEPLEEGGSIPLTLIFAEAGEVTVSAPVAAIGASAPPE